MSDLNIIDQKPELCCHLRSKGMFIHGATEVDASMPGMGDGYFWCLKTMHLLGPDSNGVNREVCRPGRACYETV